MNLSRPLEVVTPTLDGAVLEILAGGNVGFTGLQLRNLIRRDRKPSPRGVNLVLDRLSRQGIVVSEQVGRARYHRLNRDHLAADHIVGLAEIRQTLIARLRQEIAAWLVQPPYAALFGSTARLESALFSDIDLFLVRPGGLDPDNSRWLQQQSDLSNRVTRWTGNDVRILEFDERELAHALASADDVLLSVRDEGLTLAGQRDLIRPRG